MTPMIRTTHSDDKYSSVSDHVIYDLLKHPECPVRLPIARSMSQASRDFYQAKQPVVEWWFGETYINRYLRPAKGYGG